MLNDIIAKLYAAASANTLAFTDHYRYQSEHRPTPNPSEVRFILCDDAPEIIEHYPNDRRGPCCLIWGTTNSNEIGHIVCAYEPAPRVVTGYFPARTEPEKWTDDFRNRI